MKTLRAQRIIIGCCVVALVAAGILYRRSVQATLLGHYQNQQYNLFAQIHEFAPLDLDQAICLHSVPGALAEALRGQGLNLDMAVAEGRIQISAVIWGSLFDPAAAPADRTYNVIFHPDVHGWRGLAEGDTSPFNVNIHAGIFDPNGVGPAAQDSIAMNQLQPLNVNRHDRVYYSPNNGRFTVQPDRRVVTFWTVGLSEDRTRAVIMFNVLLTHADDQTALVPVVIGGAEGAEIMLDALGNLAQSMAGADRQALESAIRVIRGCLIR